MTFRRAVLFILVFALLLGCAALPAGAEHTHHWVDVPGTETPPTCTENGWKVQSCSCGQTRDVKLPALGHEFSQQVYTGYADCTHYGSFYWVCERCGAHSAIGNDKPLGHDWDEGVITKAPQGFTPGEKTYTCKRDSSHTYTEEVEPTDWLFATLEGGIQFPDFTDISFQTTNIPPLVIVKQPEGGYVDAESDEGFVMTVEAEGGEPDYTYEWYRTVQDNETLEQAKKLVGDFYRLLGMSEEAISAELDQYTLDSLSVLVGEEQEFHATQGGYGYYCVVTDSMDQKATSDIAKTKSTVSIWTHPSTTNIMDKDSVTLSCQATGGSGEYTYTWYKVSKDEEDVELGSGAMATEGANAGKLNELEVYDCGLYCCVVDDQVTGHSVTSYIARVYAAPTLGITIEDPYVTLDPTVTCEFSAVITGGVPPYQVWWEVDNSAIPCEETVEEDRTITTAESDRAGLYYVYAEDEVGNYTRQSISRYDADLKITRQPVGGTMYSNDHEDISIAIADGEAPYRYTLYLNNKVYKEETIDAAEAVFEVRDPGVYYFKVQDSTGRGCTSATARFELPDIKITVLTPEGNIKRWGDPANLEIEAEGGTEPYYYMWIKIGEDGSWYHDANFNSSHYAAYEAGDYFCIVVDAEHDSAYSKVMTVTYTGRQPIIVKQPQSNTNAALNVDGTLSGVTLTCEAVSVTKDDSDIEYVWEGYFQEYGNWVQLTLYKPTIEPTHPGLYRCRVYDGNTDQYIYSKVATVKAGLSISAKISGGEGARTELSYTVTRGKAPYRIEVYLESQYSTHDEDGHKKDIPFEVLYNYRSNIPKEKATDEIAVDTFYCYVWWDSKEQRFRRSTERADYYFVVQDAEGARITSNRIKGIDAWS